MPSAPIACFVDTNILLYPLDRRPDPRQEQARKWIARLGKAGALVISPQVVNEFCSVVLTKFRDVSDSELGEAVEAMKTWCTAPTDFATAQATLTRRRGFNARFYDALLISSALAARCRYFISEDFQHGQTIEDMRIVNPFRAMPEELFGSG
jgi:predicted nucleic acid-binding protein